METENRGLDDADIPGLEPERWETAIEDFAQLVALALDRAQDLADLINDVLRTRPVLSRAALAAVGGALVGMFIADRMRRRPPTMAEISRAAGVQAAGAARAAAGRATTTAQSAAGRAAGAAQSAAGAAQSAAGRVSERLPSREELQSRIPSREELRARIPSRHQVEAAMPERNGRHRWRPAGRPAPDGNQLRYAAELVPVGLALLRNPLVRDLLMRALVRASQSRRR